MKQISRRDFLKKTGVTLVSLPAFTSFYSFFLERFWIEVSTLRIAFPRLPLAFSGIKIVQISDIHFGYYFSTENLQNLVDRVNRLNPDLICFTGDLIEESVDQIEECTPILKKLSAPLGKVAILGNHDYRTHQVDKVVEVLEESGFIFLRNSNQFIEKLGSRVYLAGVDDLFAKPDLETTVAGIPNDQFTILLAHEPDFATFDIKHPIDFQLSGHSHGGQIQLPFYGALYRPDGAKTYYVGLNEVKLTNCLLYVNRGIGTTYLPIRFRCRPEITEFILTTLI